MTSVTMTVAETADALGVSPDTIRRWLDDGTLPEVLPGAAKRRLVPRRAIDQVIEQAMSDWTPDRISA